MVTQYTVYYADGRPFESGTVELNQVPSYKELKKFLSRWFDDSQGIHFEHVFINCTQVGSEKSMFVDDVGFLKGLPFNSAVSDQHEFYPGRIYGTAVVMSRRVWY